MRVYIMYILIAAVLIKSTRDWVFGICGYIALSALAQHEDMPRSMGGITGLNPTNVMLLWTTLMWMLQRHGGTHRPKLNGIATALVMAYVALIGFSWFQGVVDIDAIAGPVGRSDLGTFGGFTVEYLINPIKYLVPAFLIYMGLQSRRGFWMILASLGIMSILFALIVIKNIPLWTLFDEEGYMSKRRRIHRQTGLHANDMALIMTQAAWCMLMYFRVASRKWLKVGALGTAAAMILSVMLCHSRGGYAAFVVTALVVGIVCWRRILFFLVPAAVAVCIFVPTVPARILTGVDIADVSGGQTNDWDSITAGRTTFIWPAAYAQIAESPVIGAGRLCILRTEMYERILPTEARCPTHPHNAYLELLCDGGVVAFSVICMGILGVLWIAVVMSRDPRDPTARLAGSLCLVSVLPLTVMAMSGQSLWPRENILPTACLVGVALKFWVLRSSRTAPVARVPVRGMARSIVSRAVKRPQGVVQ